MRMRCLILRWLCLLLVACFFCSIIACAPKPLSPGEALTPEELAALQQELLEKEQAKKEEAEKEKEETASGTEEKKDPEPLPEGTTVYWLKKGSVYHLFPTCFYLAEKENIMEGTEEEAKTGGKEKLCSHCNKERE